ncbi:MAG: NTP transferase domain-containing protein [Puniceicoccales bacterium]|jgi:choline kinase|nr:NTP transferase domain-containing protein [Puniceicoccales bacterium]
MDITLVLLAAGIGSRYGGPKQLERFGPDRRTLVEYALHEACRYGIRRAVCVVGRQHRESLMELLANVQARMAIEFCIQEPEDLPAGAVSRRSPTLGTAHALFSARHLLDGPFLTANGDDFYGPTAWRDLMAAVRSAPDSSQLLAYRLAATLSPNGPVSRGICSVKNGKLLNIEEVHKIRMENEKILSGEKNRPLGDSTPTAMNFFYLQQNFLPLLEADGARFFASDRPAEEWGLPQAISRSVALGALQVKVRLTDSPWVGVTYPSDRAAVEMAVRSVDAVRKNS